MFVDVDRWGNYSIQDLTEWDLDYYVLHYGLMFNVILGTYLKPTDYGF